MQIKVRLDNHSGPGTWMPGDIIVEFVGYPCFDYLKGSEILDSVYSLGGSKTTLKYGPTSLKPGVVVTDYFGPSIIIVERNEKNI